MIAKLPHRFARKAAAGWIALLLAVHAMPALADDAEDGSTSASAEPNAEAEAAGASGRPLRTIEADIVAMDQAITYNRFGSINPYGMIFALRSDVVESPSGPPPVAGPDGLIPCISANEAAIGDNPATVAQARARNGALAGKVQLRCAKRPRPLVLRGNVGDRLVVRLTNLLRPVAPDASSCDQPACRGPYPDFASGGASANGGPGEAGPDANWPHTRLASLGIPGLRLVEGTDPRCTALEAIAPGETIECSYDLTRQGSFLFSSLGAPSGGEGDGGSALHGLFGVVTVEPRDSRWYRSQVDHQTMDRAWTRAEGVAGDPFRASPSRQGQIDYAQLDMLEPAGGDGSGRLRLRSGDINAVIEECAEAATRDSCRVGNSADAAGGQDLTRAACDQRPGQCLPSYREFTVVFHDELKAFYPEPYRELATERQFAGIGDGFAINYGASGMGTALLANRKGIGPAKDCVECVYEEFFLQSWANGDPALLEGYVDDPSNVHHSYLNDRVVFRNMHIGKETHVFHLHAHQWESLPNGDGQGSYLDSQTIGPGQSFSYEIYRGGLHYYGTQANLQSGSSGNRNRSIGDSIFHCHLYPHFAQGMWALWRVHDVVEDGTRRLPDGQSDGALAYDWTENGTGPRPGTDIATGVTGAGTPIPAVVPLPGQPLPPLPTYGEGGMPGYPFYIAGQPGHRAPQPPNDFAKKAGSDGGLPRHIVTGGTRGMAHLDASEIATRFGSQPPAERGRNLIRRALALGDMTAELESIDVALIAALGSPSEQRAMRFHAGRAGQVRMADGSVRTLGSAPVTGYPSLLPDRAEAAFFAVNGSLPERGAPFADPCKLGGAWDPANPKGRMRTYNVAAVQLDLVTNRNGWHDPQARINVLESDVADYSGQTRAAEPFFFRAESGDCITFNHSNRTPKDLELDDFQVATPTDTIGQHIHLVKFDVTSSDGSGNGWNYEDGTFAPDAVLERLCAAQHGTVTGGTLSVDAARCQQFHEATTAAGRFAIAVEKNVQTTTQRWFADPLLGRAADGSRGDRTLGTVFTHDHFGPSSIQQHGFYAALLIEPKGSKWRRPDGSKMPRKRKDSKAVGAAALITGADDPALHPDQREYALAIADFALLYDPPCLPAPCAAPASGDVPNPPWPADTADIVVDPAEAVDLAATGNRKGLDLLVHDLDHPRFAQVVFDEDRARLKALRNRVRTDAGVPISAPLRPESISVDHHDPYLVNYKGEPIPLRIGDVTLTNGMALNGQRRMSCAQLSAYPFAGFGAGNPVGTHGDISRRRSDLTGEFAFAFRSDALLGDPAHGDPCTPILAAYEGERMGIRLIQGAQEVQHVFTVEGLGWPRLEYLALAAPATSDNPNAIVGAQEVGISEHLEFRIPRQAGLSAGQNADFLMHFGSQDAIWNGAWGLMRVYNQRQRNDSSHPTARLAPLYGGSGLAYVTGGNMDQGGGAIRRSPADAPTVQIRAVAAPYAALGNGPLRHRDAAPRLIDPDALVLLPAREGETREGAIARHSAAIMQGPPVWRVNAGAHIMLTVMNALPPSMPDAPGDALLPRITSINVDSPAHDVGTGSVVSFALPVLPQFPAAQVGNFIGGNQSAQGLPAPSAPSTANFDFFGEYYAGRISMAEIRDSSGKPLCDMRQANGQKACRFTASAEPYAYGALPLKPLGDVFGHLAHGLFGGVIIEPAGSRVYDPASGAALVAATGANGMESFADGQPASAIVCTATAASESGPVRSAHDCAGGQGFREFVLFYQDGLNLHKPGSGTATTPVGDCTICDDSYDRGEKGVSYRSEPFWARLNRGANPIDEHTNLNTTQFPANFFATGAGAIATPTFRAVAGETVKFRVIQPGGRARQRTFEILGNDYPDLLPFATDANGDPAPRFGTSAAALMAPGKAITATLTCVRPGTYIYRDGPTHLFSGGVWGHLVVEPARAGTAPASACAVQGGGE